MTKSKFIEAARKKRPDIQDVISPEHKYGSIVRIIFANGPEFQFSSNTLNPYSVTNLKKIGVS